METAFLWYNFTLIPIIFVSLPIQSVFKKEVKTSGSEYYWAGRLGVYTESLYLRLEGMSRPRIWLQAASVGEVGVAAAIISELEKLSSKASIILSVTTKHGLSAARKQIPPDVLVIPYPLDLPNVIASALDVVKPDVYVCLETEIWPNMVFLAHRRKISLVLLNGRISLHSFKNYRRTSRFWSSVLDKFSRFIMTSEKNRERIIALGASPDKVEVIENVKFSRMFDEPDFQEEKKWRQKLNLTSNAPVIVGGSLRREENIWLLEIFRELQKEYPQIIGIFAPRHIKRTPALAKWLNENNIPFQKVSSLLHGREKRNTPVILIDVIGELAKIYSVATLVFCGGSLVPVGGHNILEPALWKKPVFYGHYMNNFSDMKEFVEEIGLGFEVSGRDELLLSWKEALKMPGKFEERTGKVEGISVTRDAASRQAMKILEIIYECR